jgi:AcrR family transcriptional regulator
VPPLDQAGIEPARPPGRPRSERAEQAILAATLELLAEHGIAGLSIEAVAARARVAKTTVYRRWSTKDDLVMDAIVQLSGPPPEPAAGPVRDQLIELLVRARGLQAGAESAGLMRRISAEAKHHPKLMDEFWRRVVTPRREAMYAVLRRGCAEGVIRADVDLVLLADLLVGPVLLRSVIRPAPISREQIASIVDCVLTGVEPPGPGLAG